MDKKSKTDLPISIVAALCAVFLLGIIIFVGQNYAQGLEQKYIHAIAPLYPDSVINGSAFEKVAFSTPDLLPVFGSSEEHLQDSPFQANNFFRTYPTGFAPFDACKGYAQSITEALALASVGNSLNGKKVVISFTPKQFSAPPLSEKMYSGFFTALHANELIFSPFLTYQTKQLAAERMLEYPKTLQGDPLLLFATQQLASGTTMSKILYWASFPLGRLQADIMELQDHYQSVAYIFQNKAVLDSSSTQHVPEAINWQSELASATTIAQQQAAGDQYGFSPSVRERVARMFHAQPVGSADQEYLNNLNSSGEFENFGLLLQILKELGAKPILVGRPIKDNFYNHIGISDDALNQYYVRIEALAAQYDVPLFDFKQFQNDIYFGIDPTSHTSQEGWVHVDQIYDKFYHEHIQ
jgi:D-alanine transfer protein